MFLGHTMVSLGISFLVSLCLEVPFPAMEKLMFAKKETKAQEIKSKAG